VALKAFLQDVNQGWIPWYSDADILAGQRWGAELATELETTEYGIVCVTQESLQNPWPMFEAGALSKSVKGARLCPYLIDIARSQLIGPLSQFQAKEASNASTWEMLQSINLSMPGGSLPEARLKKYFDLFWPSLEEVLETVNRELRPLPQPLRQKLINTLAPMFHRVAEIEMHALESDLPIWEVNLNQAAIHVWREVIQLAVRDKKLQELMQNVEQNFGEGTRFAELLAEVSNWSLSLKSSI